ncbi:uncharacterized protein LOC135490703 [Lineus longissimus]|uniref:uncharacterized protein LOC135490703 n=1 Tax=Lineus longissimus TaxID=88925 RepID=UPI00315CB30A
MAISLQLLALLACLVVVNSQMVDITRQDYWVLLGPRIEPSPEGLRGLTLAATGGTTPTQGPDGLNAWVFTGQNYVKITNDGTLNLASDSFTIATYVYQDALRNGPILEWRGRGPYGTHMWIWRSKLFVNLDAFTGKNAAQYHRTPQVGKWSFVGVSFNRTSGALMMWDDDDVMTRNVGVIGDRDMDGDLYIGVRPANVNYKFTGKLAGTTLLKCAINEKQIQSLRRQIIEASKPAVDISGLPSWLLLGPRIEPSPEGLRGLTLAATGGTTLAQGPDGLNAWVFTGQNYVKITNDGTLNLASDSFTIATYVYQDALRNGPILEWRGRGPYGTHMWIWSSKLFVNLDAFTGRSAAQYHTTPQVGKWSFVGVSFNRTSGALMMWDDDDVMTRNVGVIGDRDMNGDLYIGVRPANVNYKFTGKLAGTTLLKCAINEKQIQSLRRQIIEAAKPAVDISGLPSWLLLGPRIEPSPEGLRGLTLAATGGTTLTQGPDGLNAWVFTGQNYVKITNDGTLNLASDSFTIATFVYQDALRNGPILEWRGRGPYGTHMWIWSSKLFVNLDAFTGRSAAQYHTTPQVGKWSFVGVSFNRTSGALMMWDDDDVMTRNVGVIGDRDMDGDLYIGVRPANVNYKFTGKLAGTTLLKCAINEKQIQSLRRQIIEAAKPAVDISGLPSWLLLGPRIEPSPEGLRGLTLAATEGTTLTQGPDGLNAWVFTGLNYVKITNDGTLNLASDSFTIATYVYQDALRNGPILEWRGRGSYGTHMWIWSSKLFVNLDAFTGRSAAQYHTTPPVGKWSFVGVSFNRTSGALMMWDDDDVMTRNVGVIGDRDMDGDLYIGVRPANVNYKFIGKLAGTTLLKCAINEKQIQSLRRQIIEAAKPAVDISGLPSWLLLGPRIEPSPEGLRGLTLAATGETTLTQGPDGLNAWVFTGQNYVKITNDGTLNLASDSFTIATYVYQDALRNGPILEWRGRGPYGTHMWIWSSKLFVNLDAFTGRSAAQYHTTPQVGKWSFVGVSFNRSSGALMMWDDDDVMTRNVGVIGDRDMDGDLYIGVRPANVNYKFIGKLAGTTLLKFAINEKQIESLRRQIIEAAKPAVDISGLPSWLLLGPRIEPSPEGLRGLTLAATGGTTLTQGPDGLNAWVFTGQNYVKITNDGTLNLASDSFTIATYVYQDALRNGPILEWRGRGSYGTHMWIWSSKLFVNLDAFTGRSAAQYHTTPQVGKWSFVGVSFNRSSGALMMWDDDDVMTRSVGVIGDRDMDGDLYIGVRPANVNYKFTGKLAGTTLLKCAINEKQIQSLRRQIIEAAKPADACVSSPCQNGATCTVIGEDFHCACRDNWLGKVCESQINFDISGLPSWLLLGPRIEPSPEGLRGLTLAATGGTTLTQGPDGLNAWVFTGQNYVKITNDGTLNLASDSFTIATYVYQDALRNGPILEWRGRGPYGTHMWIWSSKLFVNLDAFTGRSAAQYHTTPQVGKWSFVGVSFNRTSGALMMWDDDDVMTRNVGVIGDRDMDGDLYIGVRPANVNYKFIGKLAGTTLLKCAINEKQIQSLRRQIIEAAKPADACVSSPCQNGATCTVIGEDFHCACRDNWLGKVCESQINFDISGLPSWLLLGPRIEPSPEGLRGLTLAATGGTTLTQGPDGLNAWVFTGQNYVKITNDGTLNLASDSFTIATYVYQDALRNGPILEWRGRGPYGTHMWIWSSKLFVNLDAFTGRSAAQYHTTPQVGKWSFVGVSFNRTSGALMMWDDDDVMTRNVGVIGDRDMDGDLYIGVRPANVNYKFTGKLAGTTLLKCAINEKQIQSLRRQIIAAAEPTEQSQKKQIICEKASDTISCIGGSINIVYANYGRTNSFVCPAGLAFQKTNTNCLSEAATLAKVRNECHGKTTCSLSVSNEEFGDSCFGTTKYLDVHYTCRGLP